MTLPVYLQGNRWRLMRGNGASPEVFQYLCLAVTQDLDQKTDFDDSIANDCDDPTALAQRVSTPKSQTWDLSFSGKCDAKRYQIIQADFDSATPRTYQLLTDLPAAQGGGTHSGLAFIDSLKKSKTENGVVAFSATLKGQGFLIWTPAGA